jgi:hypothetical protein
MMESTPQSNRITTRSKAKTEVVAVEIIRAARNEGV